jgi:precorrin-6A/cobalt-precorrin-6A reductase
MDNQRRVAALSAAIGLGENMRHILILGGTFEARQLAGHLATRDDLRVTLSLAGRTAQPAPQPVPVRSGGFGGVEGFAAYLIEARVDVLIDATHPYAATMSAHAAEAAARAGVQLLALQRAPWQAVAGDHWREVADSAEAVRALGKMPRRVFLAIGRKEVAVFAAAPQHKYLIRTVDPITPPLALPHAEYLLARGPFAETDERALLSQHRIDMIVAKNSGGEATYGKIAAARALGIDVILLRRPSLPAVPTVHTIGDALAWLDHAFASLTLRGV